MKTGFKVCLTILLLLISASVFAQVGERVSDFNGDFSICPPLGWKLMEFPGNKYKGLYSTVASEGFTPNFVFVDDAYRGNLYKYAEYNLKQLGAALPGFKLISRDEFKTNSGLTGEKMITNYSAQGFFFKSVFYFFPTGKNKFLVITCSSLDSSAAQNHPLFEESMKTLELTK